jgi:hypothetical protein
VNDTLDATEKDQRVLVTNTLPVWVFFQSIGTTEPIVYGVGSEERTEEGWVKMPVNIAVIKLEWQTMVEIFFCQKDLGGTLDFFFKFDASHRLRLRSNPDAAFMQVFFRESIHFESYTLFLSRKKTN